MQISRLMQLPCPAADAQAEHVGRDGLALLQAGEPQGVDEGQVHGDVDGRHGQRAQQQGAEDVLLRMADFRADIGHFVPAAVGKEDEDQRQAQIERLRRRAARPAPPRRRKNSCPPQRWPAAPGT